VRPLTALLLVGLAAGAAAAQTEPPPPPTPTPPAEDPTAGKPPKEKKPKLDVKIGGRVFAAAVWRSVDGDDTTDLELRSARLEARKKWRDFTLVAEVELEGSPDVRDAYIRWDSQPPALDVRVVVGNFKPPISAIELESAWNLPTASRGLLNDILLDAYAIAGRRPGVAVSVGPRRARFTAGVFQGSFPDGNPVDEVGVGAQNIAGRGQLELGPVMLGAFGELRAVRLDEIRHFWDAGLDAQVERGGLRVWADLIIGESFRDYTAAPDDASIFVSGRAIVAWRWRGVERGDGYVEPYARFGLLDTDVDFGSDQVLDLAVGANVGRWDQVRVGLELEVNEIGDNQPTNDPIGDGGAMLVDEIAVVARVGMVF
jgi:hypothetical protein